MTWGWREKDRHGGTREYADIANHATAADAQAHRNTLMRWHWADDEFKVDCWVGPIVESEGGIHREIGRTVRRDDPVSVPADSRAQMERIRVELRQRWSLPKDD